MTKLAVSDLFKYTTEILNGKFNLLWSPSKEKTIWAMFFKYIHYCLKSGYFQAGWKKANVVLVHKKGNKQIMDNYQPVSL